MSETDPFAGGVEAPETDPFAGGDGEGFTQDPDPFTPEGGAVTTEPVEGVPVVDAEGNPVQGSSSGDGATPDAPSETDEEKEQREAAEASAAEAEADFDRQVPDPSQSPAATEGSTGDQSPAAQDAPAPAAAPSPTPASATESGDGSGSEATSDGGQAAEDPTSASSDAQAAPDASPESSAEPGAAAGSEELQPGEELGPDGKTPIGGAAEEEPPERQEERDDKGNLLKRPYKLLTPDGSGKWKDVVWYEDKDGRMVDKGTTGARKQNVCLVRGQEEALRIGYRAMGSPPDGCKIVAVASSYFKIKTVKPDIEPQPRVRLKIS